MDKKTTILIIVLFSLIVLGMFVYANLKSNELETMVDIATL